MKRWVGVMTWVLGVAAFGCGDDSSTGAPGSSAGPLEVIGSYTWADDGASYNIDAATWDDSPIIEFDNSKNRAVLDETDAGYGFSVVFWIPPSGGKFYVCRIAYGLQTAEEARRNTEVPSTASPATTGCGPVAWNEFRSR